MKKWLLRWWPLWAWVALAALILLAAPYVPYKLFEFLFLFWIGISLVGGIPVGVCFWTDLEETFAKRPVVEPFVGPRIKREFDWKRMRMVETDTRPEICKAIQDIHNTLDECHASLDRTIALTRETNRIRKVLGDL